MRLKATVISGFRERFRELLSINEPPHRLALAFSIGLFVGISPALGLHTVLGIAIAWLLGLNRVATLIGVYVTNPWTIVPIYTFSTWVGARLIGAEDILPDVKWSDVGFSGFVRDFGHLLKPFVAGTLFVGSVSSIASFAAIYFLLRKRQKEKTS